MSGHAITEQDAPTVWIPIKEYPSALFAHTVKAVCQRCNNGWMADLEARAERILAPLLRGEPTALHPRHQKVLATWAVKTALVMSHLRPWSEAIPRSEYREFFESQVPGPRHLVWIAQRNAPTVDGQKIVEMAIQPVTNILVYGTDPIDEASRAYRATFGVGRLAMQVFGQTFADPFTLQIPHDLPASPVWPPTASFTWPDKPALETAIRGVLGWHETYDNVTWT